jgi:hypothetical protein
MVTNLWQPTLGPRESKKWGKKVTEFALWRRCHCDCHRKRRIAEEQIKSVTSAFAAVNNTPFGILTVGLRRVPCLSLPCMPF